MSKSTVLKQTADSFDTKNFSISISLLLKTVILIGSKRNISVGWKILESVQKKIKLLLKFMFYDQKLQRGFEQRGCGEIVFLIRSQINTFFLFFKSKIVIFFKTTNKNK